MYDLNMYNATRENPGGPIFLEEEFSPLSPKYFGYNLPADDRPLTRGRAIGGLVSLALLIGVGAYLALAI